VPFGERLSALQHRRPRRSRFAPRRHRARRLVVGRDAHTGRQRGVRPFERLIRAPLGPACPSVGQTSGCAARASARRNPRRTRCGGAGRCRGQPSSGWTTRVTRTRAVERRERLPAPAHGSRRDRPDVPWRPFAPRPLADRPPDPAEARRAWRTHRDVAEVLDNTPAVCRRSHVHPGIVDAYHGGAPRLWMREKAGRRPGWRPTSGAARTADSARMPRS
jgi:hypothetical protein